MALVKCRECGKEMSTTAAACPACGAKPKKKTSAITWIVLGLIVVGVIGTMFGGPDKGAPPVSGGARTTDVATTIREQRAKDEAAARAAFDKDGANIIAAMKRANAAGKPEEAEALGKKYSGVTDSAFLGEIAKADSAIAVKLQRAAKAQAKTEGVRIGMTKEEVLGSSWGKPQSVNTTTTRYGSHEQWVYGGRNYLYFDNDKLTSIQN